MAFTLCMERSRGRTTLYGPHRYVRSQTELFLNGLEMSSCTDFDHFVLECREFYTRAWHWIFCPHGTYIFASTWGTLQPFSNVHATGSNFWSYIRAMY